MSTRVKGKQIMVTLPPALYERVKGYADSNCMSVSAVGAMALKSFLDTQDQMPALQDMVKGFTNLMTGKVPLTKEALEELNVQAESLKG